MKILLSNDDGVFALGLNTLYQYLSQQHDVTVIAPDRNCSGMSNALSLHSPLRIQKMDNGFYSVNGTPSDCVQVGINCFLKEEPHLVISGINHGPNLGDDIIYSGTVAAAFEGRHMGLPAIAVSTCSKEVKHLESAAQIVCDLVSKIQEHPLRPNEILNVNVPDIPLAKIKGIKATRSGRRHRADTMIKDIDPFGKEIFWYGKIGMESDAGEGTDFDAVNNNYCSVTPLSVDMTVHDHIENMNSWLKD
ncbi:5'/3'-nucleotidase SurE [Glaciecola sp. KUL10]|uniref:5'/3'-nucleotidase SurE n=1 Tax=Glaciecola sp. (strain KUL10) TaxID=2161813 RepID=UPI000D78818D|nr:5'/3'-nucleotidase SurE [Glaciecola sp. KUL10]GBL05471.1 stationary-phase survival protein SurE [Glaciecola sp. KUL10]